MSVNRCVALGGFSRSIYTGKYSALHAPRKSCMSVCAQQVYSLYIREFDERDSVQCFCRDGRTILGAERFRKLKFICYMQSGRR